MSSSQNTESNASDTENNGFHLHCDYLWLQCYCLRLSFFGGKTMAFGYTRFKTGGAVAICDQDPLCTCLYLTSYLPFVV